MSAGVEGIVRALTEALQRAGRGGDLQDLSAAALGDERAAPALLRWLAEVEEDEALAARIRGGPGGDAPLRGAPPPAAAIPPGPGSLHAARRRLREAQAARWAQAGRGALAHALSPAGEASPGAPHPPEAPALSRLRALSRARRLAGQGPIPPLSPAELQALEDAASPEDALAALGRARLRIEATAAAARRALDPRGDPA